MMNVPIMVVVGALLLVLGGMFWLVATVSGRYYQELYLKCICTVNGVVSGTSESHQLRNMGNIKTYYPIYRYTVDGKDYHCRGNKGAHKKDKVDQADATIFYDPQNPASSYLDRATNDKIFLAMRLAGTAFLALGVVLILVRLLVL